MPVSIFPEVAFHRVTVIARAGDLPVEQTLTAVTQPLENAMTGVLGVETIRSMTTRGGAQLDLVFGWNDDMLRALQLVQAAMEETRRQPARRHASSRRACSTPRRSRSSASR